MNSKCFKKESGQAMVEFALVLPILLLLIAGIIDFGWIFHNQVVANNACREATRYAAIHHNESLYESDTRQIVKDYLINITDGEIFIDKDPANDNVTVSLNNYSIKVLTPILSTILNDEFIIKASTTMKLE